MYIQESLFNFRPSFFKKIFIKIIVIPMHIGNVIPEIFSYNDTVKIIPYHTLNAAKNGYSSFIFSIYRSILNAPSISTILITNFRKNIQLYEFHHWLPIHIHNHDSIRILFLVFHYILQNYMSTLLLFSAHGIFSGKLSDTSPPYVLIMLL